MSNNLRIKKIKTLFSSLQFPNWTIPIFFLVETVIAYGLLGVFQGFYFDDWPMIWLIKSNANYWGFYAYDRPFSAWTLYLTAPILRTNTLAWHAFAILLRWLITLSIWWVLILIWRKQKRIITLIGILFVVYPAFIQQPISVAYSQHFLTYLLFLLSFGFMLSSLGGDKRRFWVFTILGLVTQGLHLFTMEYFWGLEFVRFLGLYFYFAQREDSTPRELIRKVGKSWLPYLVVFIAALIWRLYIYAPIEDPNELRLLAMFLNDPLNTLRHFLEMILRDSLQMTIKTWDKTLQISLIDLKDRFLMLVWLVAFSVSAGLVFYFRKLSLATEAEGTPHRKQFVAFGLVIMLLGPLPVWLTNKQITIGMYSDRFALAGMFGAAILLVVFLDWVLSTNLQTLVSVAVLVGLAVGLQIRTGNDYRWAWVNQQRFVWQMHWRVPGLEPNTAVFSEGAIFHYTGDYPTSFLLNLLYPADESGVTQVPYWFFELDRGFLRYKSKYLKGQVMKDHLRSVTFKGWSLDSILIDYNPDQGNCLWVVGKGDELISSLPDITREALPLSDLSRIKPFGENAPDKLFGGEAAHTWCYYFEKAELARQMGDWQRVIKLADDVMEKGFEPQNRFEWRPFVDGYLHSGDYQGAKDLSLRAYQSGKGVGDMLCSMWIARVKEVPEDTQLLKYAESIEDQLQCKW